MEEKATTGEGLRRLLSRIERHQPEAAEAIRARASAADDAVVHHLLARLLRAEVGHRLHQLPQLERLFAAAPAPEVTTALAVALANCA